MPHNEATSDDTVLTSLNRANPNGVNDMFRLISIGDVIAGGTLSNRNVNMDAQPANPYTLTTLDTLTLPDELKGSAIVSAHARVGGVTGPLGIVLLGLTPSTGEIGVSPSGDIVTLAADAITNLEVVYNGVVDAVVVEAVFPVVGDAIALPATMTDPGVIDLLEAEVLEGTGTGNKAIGTIGIPAPVGGAALDIAKASVLFNAAAVATRARVKLLVGKAAAETLAAILASPAVTA